MTMYDLAIEHALFIKTTLSTRLNSDRGAMFRMVAKLNGFRSLFLWLYDSLVAVNFVEKIEDLSDQGKSSLYNEAKQAASGLSITKKQMIDLCKSIYVFKIIDDE